MESKNQTTIYQPLVFIRKYPVFALIVWLLSGIWACNSPDTSSTENQADATTADSTASGGAETTAAQPEPAKMDATYGNIHFAVTTSQRDGQSYFTVTPSGYTASNEPVEQSFSGSLKNVVADDIDGDNQPELAVVTAEGAEGYGKAYVFSSNSDKSMSQVNLPELDAGNKALEGYKGGDEFAFVEGSFIRRFPVPEGGEGHQTRQLQYKLRKGEAMKQLVLDKTVDY